MKILKSMIIAAAVLSLPTIQAAITSKNRIQSEPARPAHRPPNQRPFVAPQRPVAPAPAAAPGQRPPARPVNQGQPTQSGPGRIDGRPGRIGTAVSTDTDQGRIGTAVSIDRDNERLGYTTPTPGRRNPYGVRNYRGQNSSNFYRNSHDGRGWVSGRRVYGRPLVSGLLQTYQPTQAYSSDEYVEDYSPVQTVPVSRVGYEKIIHATNDCFVDEEGRLVCPAGSYIIAE